MDKVSAAVLRYVTVFIGQPFIEPPTFDIAVSYADSTRITPLIFILTTGADPVADMLAFANDRGMSQKLEAISLGQGQGPKARRMIENAKQHGGWVLLCNCHLSISWLPELEQICEQINPAETHSDFRLWLTSMPTTSFPALLLQNGVKMTNEPPKGVRANLLTSYSKFDDRILEESTKPEIYKRLLFAFCFFHAILQDRRKFGPIGWNIPYGFTFEDLVTCRRQLRSFVDDYDEPPLKSLIFMGAAINYGGRVTDDKDKRLIQSILASYLTQDLVDKGPDFKFTRTDKYYCPAAESRDDFVDYIKTLPLSTGPDAFGMDDNCEITCAIGESQKILENSLLMAPTKSSGGGKSASDAQDEIAAMISEQTPKLFDMDELEENFPTLYEDSSNTVLKQESFKYNRLLQRMQSTLPQFRKALKGLVAMSEELDAMGVALFANAVPPNFEKVGFLNEMPLSAWIKDLNRRWSFLSNWIETKNLIICWISGFFFPQAFLTATLQNNARSTRTAIDCLAFIFAVDSKASLDGSNYTEKPPTGCRIYGLFIEGCKWDIHAEQLRPSDPKILFSQVPPVFLNPVPDKEVPRGVYFCPIYKTLSRRGTLSTTGHLMNFVMYIDLPAESSEVCIVAGVACFLALRSSA